MARVRSPSEDFARNLELQAQVDTYLVLLLFVAFFRKPNAFTHRPPLARFHLFARPMPGSVCDRTSGRVIWRRPSWPPSYAHYLDTLNGARRLDEIRRFRSLDYSDKKKRILALPGGEIFIAARGI